MATSTLESTVKAEWGEAKGFYWTPLLEEVGNYLLKEKGEDEEDVIDALCGLIKYKVKKLEHLQNISDSKKEFRDALTAKGVPDAICDLLFEKYVEKKKRSASDESDGDRKRQKILDRSKPEAIGKMCSVLHKSEAKQDVYSFASEVLDSKNSILYVRESYPKMYAQLWALAIMKTKKGKIEHFPVIVTGTSGVGKSFFGIYALLRAVSEMNITVVYTLYGDNNLVKQYVVAPPAAKMANFAEGDPRRLLLDLRKEFVGMIGEDKVDESENESIRMGESMWWGEINQTSSETQKFVDRLTGGESTWVFADIQKGTIAQPTSRVVVLVSDDPKAYSSFLKHKSGIRLVMSVWTEQELLDARAKIELEIDDADVKERYGKVGGVPRSVFSKRWDTIEDDLRRAIQGLEAVTLPTTLVPGSNPQVTSRLVHQVSKFPFYNKAGQQEVVSSVFASEYVRTAIYNRFLFEEQFKLQTWLRYTKGIVGGGERGPQFEWFAHVVLGKLERNLVVKLTKLFLDEHNQPSGVGATEQMELKPFASKTRIFHGIEDIDSVEVGVYMQPSDDYQAAFDAFCLVKGVPWEEDSDELTLILFQMTVAQKHPTIGEPIKKLINRIGEVNKNFDVGHAKVFFVFVVEKPFAKAEPYLTTGAKKTALKQGLGCLHRIQQICLQVE